ncbi:MAG: Uma2 family endonuclease [Chloroflexi bacterium]|nr:Uma2 family endonuclease [Chloroflexota bacterium]
MSIQGDAYERRRFTVDEYDTLLEVGILSPDEGAILLDEFIMVPANPTYLLGLNRDPGPLDATDPSDLVLMEPPPALETLREVSGIMNTLAAEPQEDYIQRKFTVDEYYRMGEAGVLSPDERTELLEGEIILMAPIGSRHASCVDFFTKATAPLALADRVILRVQNPVFLDQSTEVQPDIALVRPASYADAHPRPEDVLLLIEVADTTIGADRRDKLPAYAEAGIPEAWLADVNAQAVDIHTDPRDGAYANVRTVEMDGALTPTAFPDVVISVRDVFRW